MKQAGRILVALLIGLGTYLIVLKISQVKNERLAGDDAYQLDASHKAESDGFDAMLEQLRELGKPELADRLFQLQYRGRIWVVPALRGNRWAVYVNTLNMVHRIYIEQKALTNPQAHFFSGQSVTASERQKLAFAWINLGGVLYHELQHYDGIYDEATVYEREIAWYRSIEAPDAAYSWAIDRAIWTAKSGKAQAK